MTETAGSMDSDGDGAAGPGRSDVRAALAAIRASGVLGKSERRAELLDYLVERELAGEGELLKAFSIAVDVFGRDESFDPGTDSIVRTEVGRLREALALFWAQNADPQLPRIDIPKGTYRPAISAPPPAPAPAAPVRRRVRAGPLAALALCVLALGLGWAFLDGTARQPERTPGPDTQNVAPYSVLRIALIPFEGSGDDERAARLAFGLYSELERDLSAYPWIAVISPLGAAPADSADVADYVLTGRLLWQGDTLRANAELVSLRDQQVAWSKARTFRTTVAAFEETERLLATGIVNKLAGAHGIGPDLVRQLNAETSEANLDSFLCFLGMYEYLQSPSDRRHAELRSCLSQVVAAYPRYGDAWAALALIYMDEARFGRNPRPGAEPWRDAGRAVGEALTYAPLAMVTLNAAVIYSIESPNRDLDAFDRHAERLLELFPHHPATLANVGSRKAEFEGRWDRGLALVREAIRLEPRPPSWFFVAPAFRAMLEDDAALALQATQPLTAPGSRTERLLCYVAAARNGLIGRMQEERRLLAEAQLVTEADIRAHVRNRRYDAEIEEALLRQLDRAFAIERSQ